LRLLLLGKAHYGLRPDEDGPDFTRQLIGRVRDGFREPFFTKTSSLVSPLLPHVGAVAADFWDQVAFFNYIPNIVGQGVHDSPTPSMLKRAGERFVELVDLLCPTHVLSLGKEQWNRIHFPPDWTSTETMVTARGTIRLWRSPSLSVVATPIDHPTASHGFSAAEWSDHVAQFLATVAPVGV
jgi:hypothetical protein